MVFDGLLDPVVKECFNIGEDISCKASLYLLGEKKQ